MQTNDFIKELDKVPSANFDLKNNLWNGFPCDGDGFLQYKDFLNSLYIDYFNEVDTHLDNLLLSKSRDDIKLFINSKISRFGTIKSKLDKQDNLSKEKIDVLQCNFDNTKWDENSEYCQKYEKMERVSMEQHISRRQLIYDFLTFSIGISKMTAEMPKWTTHEQAEENGFTKDSLERWCKQLQFERLGREYLNNSLKNLNDKYNFYSEQVEEKTSERTVNSEELKNYFSSTFKGMGNGNINHFDMLIEELQRERTAKEFAQIALMIYESKKMNDRKPQTFAKWYKLFCDSVGCKHVKSYDPNKLENPQKNLRNLFSYL